MVDNIIIKKEYEDSECILLEVECTSCKISAISKVFVSNMLIDELITQIQHFLTCSLTEAEWSNEKRGNGSSACLSLRFIKKDKLGHIWIEVYMEIDDGGDFDRHNCCFYINTEVGLLMSFCDHLDKLKYISTGYGFSLNAPT